MTVIKASYLLLRNITVSKNDALPPCPPTASPCCRQHWREGSHSAETAKSRLCWVPMGQELSPHGSGAPGGKPRFWDLPQLSTRVRAICQTYQEWEVWAPMAQHSLDSLLSQWWHLQSQEGDQASLPGAPPPQSQSGGTSKPIKFSACSERHPWRLTGRCRSRTSLVTWMLILIPRLWCWNMLYTY